MTVIKDKPKTVGNSQILCYWLFIKIKGDPHFLDIAEEEIENKGR